MSRLEDDLKLRNDAVVTLLRLSRVFVKVKSKLTDPALFISYGCTDKNSLTSVYILHIIEFKFGIAQILENKFNLMSDRSFLREQYQFRQDGSLLFKQLLHGAS